MAHGIASASIWWHWIWNLICWNSVRSSVLIVMLLCFISFDEGFILLLDVSPVVLLMEPVQDAQLEMYQSSFGRCTKACANVLSSSKVYCRQIKSSLGSMISTLGSIQPILDYDSRCLWWRSPWWTAFQEAKDKRSNLREMSYTWNLLFSLFWWFFPPKQGQNSNQKQGAPFGFQVYIIYVASWFLGRGEPRSWGFQKQERAELWSYPQLSISTSWTLHRPSSLIKGNWLSPLTYVYPWYFFCSFCILENYHP